MLPRWFSCPLGSRFNVHDHVFQRIHWTRRRRDLVTPWSVYREILSPLPKVTSTWLVSAISFYAVAFMTKQCLNSLVKYWARWPCTQTKVHWAVCVSEGRKGSFFSPLIWRGDKVMLSGRREGRLSHWRRRGRVKSRIKIWCFDGIQIFSSFDLVFVLKCLDSLSI